MIPASSSADLSSVLRSFIEDGTPHNRAVGMRMLTAAPGEIACTIPYSPELAADEPGGLDAGTIATLIDVACGGSVCMRLGGLRRIATLELRIDFLRAPQPDRALTAEGHCYRVEDAVAFVRASVHDGDRRDVVACAQGTFLVTGD